ncbi:hypothetical protein R6Q57_021236 [Mikania cordata]
MEADLFPPDQHFENVQERGGYDHHAVESSTTTTTKSDMNPMVHQPAPNCNLKSVANSSANESKLKAEAADTELDILLNSLDDVNLTQKAPLAKKNTLDFDIDSTLDDLLKETSTPSLVDQNNASLAQHASNSGPLDDFDSWLDTI